MSNIQINNLNLYYEISGDGPPLVLLPGLLGTIESDWRRFIPSLAQHYRTIAVDLRGHGRTNNPARDLDIGLMSDDLTDLMDRLVIERASVLGYSLGGMIGLLTGLKWPGRISALVMHGTKFFWDESSLSSMAASFDSETILKKSPRYAQSLQQNHSAVYGNDYWKDLLKVAVPFLRTMPEKAPNLEQTSKAGFPVLVSVGDHDQLISLEEAIRLFRSLPKGELLVVPSTRHQLNSVQLEAFIPVMLNFLERSLEPKD
jgi:pimeloyl-ACP methyl ester carboxylesterase